MFSIFAHTSWSKNYPFEIRTAIEIYLKHDTWADMSFSRLYHDPLLHVFLGFMICMHPFFFFFRFLFHDIHPLCAGFCFSSPSRLVRLFPDFGWMHFLCVPVLSLPVQCWSLSYGKQRRPFRLYAPTWLRQQVWRPLYFFCTWSLFFLLQPSLSLFLSLFGFLCMSLAQHLSRLIFLLTFLRERNSLSREEKLQIKSWNSGGWNLKREKKSFECCWGIRRILVWHCDVKTASCSLPSGAHTRTGKKSLKLPCEWIFTEKRVQTLINHFFWWKRWSGKESLVLSYLIALNLVFLFVFSCFFIQYPRF